MRKTQQRHSKRQRKEKVPFKRPNTARQYFLLSPKNQKTWDSIGHVISRVREKMTLRKAAKEFGIAPGIVVALGRSALRRQHGQYVAKKTDRLLRVVNALTAKGRKEIATRASRQASLIGGHWA